MSLDTEHLHAESQYRDSLHHEVDFSLEEEEGKKFREISLETYDGIEEKGQYPPSILRRIPLFMKSIEINGKVLMIMRVYLQYGIKTKIFLAIIL